MHRLQRQRRLGIGGVHGDGRCRLHAVHYVRRDDADAGHGVCFDVPDSVSVQGRLPADFLGAGRVELHGLRGRNFQHHGPSDGVPVLCRRHLLDDWKRRLPRHELGLHSVRAGHLLAGCGGLMHGVPLRHVLRDGRGGLHDGAVRGRMRCGLVRGQRRLCPGGGLLRHQPGRVHAVCRGHLLRAILRELRLGSHRDLVGQLDGLHHLERLGVNVGNDKLLALSKRDPLAVIIDDDQRVALGERNPGGGGGGAGARGRRGGGGGAGGPRGGG
jgi:hypothetical protein